MPTENWGMLQKSQVDPETVEEAIDRLVAVHEADPDSHLGADESLQSHKAAEIIDHVAGSVKADKFSSTEGIFETSFDSIDAFTKAGAVELASWGNVHIYWGVDNPADASIYSIAPIAINFTDFSKDLLFQVLFGVATDSTTDINLGVNVLPQITPSKGFGFFHDNSGFKAYFHDGSVCHYSDVLSISLVDVHVWRILNFAGEKTLRFYVDGVELWSYIYDSPPGACTGYVNLFFVGGVSGEGEATLHKFTLSRQI